MRQAVEFAAQYLEGYRPYKSYWNYEDGCVLKGCMDLYRATGNETYRDFVLRYLDKLVTPDGFDGMPSPSLSMAKYMM